jgi:hypothetical protein
VPSGRSGGPKDGGVRTKYGGGECGGRAKNGKRWEPQRLLMKILVTKTIQSFAIIRVFRTVDPRHTTDLEALNLVDLTATL